MIKSISDTTVPHNGVHMPWLGLGVYKAEDGQEVINAIQYALEAGYRSIDTASFYKNEEGVGQALMGRVFQGKNFLLPQKCGIRSRVTKPHCSLLKKAERSSPSIMWICSWSIGPFPASTKTLGERWNISIKRGR